MHRRAILAGTTVALAGCSDILEGPDAGEAETLVREAIADERGAADAPACDPSDTLQTAARDHCRDMHARDFYAHENPDGEQPWDRVPCQAAETIHRGEIGEMRTAGRDGTYQTAMTDDLAAYVADGWVASESHYETLIDPQWSAVGVGIVIRDGAFFATAMFC